MRFSTRSLVLSLLTTLAACEQMPRQPLSPGLALSLACPADITQEAGSPQGAEVTFDQPLPTGGRVPYRVECSPTPSSVFVIGETAVHCTATDAAMSATSCRFAVTVRVSQSISKTTFMAFGDSITEGAVSLSPRIMLDGPETYPSKLEQMVQARYRSQEIRIFNRGFGGDDTSDGARRLPALLDLDKPEVLLLLQGINAINSLTTARQVVNLRSMVTEAQRRRIDVILATVMPVSPTWRHYQRGVTAERILALNAQIAALASELNLGKPVDLFRLFEASPQLIGADGLHPTVEGQTRIAEAFRDEIVGRYDGRPNSLDFFNGNELQSWGTATTVQTPRSPDSQIHR